MLSMLFRHQYSVPTESSITPDALVMKSVTVELRQIPNQPITFMVKSRLFAK